MLARVALPILLSSALMAQYVSPSHFTNAEGTSNNVFPFGNTTIPFRYSQVHDDVPAPMIISGMAFRHNSATTVYQAHSVTIDAWMSTSLNPAATMSTTFDNNHGVDKAQVVVNRTYSHPVSNPFDLPGAFVLDYPFDTPFVYVGGGSLCWEVQVTAKTQTGSVVYDFLTTPTVANTTNPPIQLGRTGLGCLATGRTAVMAATAAQTTAWTTPTATMTVNGSNLEANGFVVVTTGLDKTVWNSTPLPAAIPTSTGAPSGTCTVYADVIAVTFMQASATGTLSLASTFAPQPAYHGITMYSQIWGLDLPANPFGVTTSNVAMHHIVAPFAMPYPMSRVFLSASLGPTGTFGANGLITKFY